MIGSILPGTSTSELTNVTPTLPQKITAKLPITVPTTIQKSKQTTGMGRTKKIPSQSIPQIFRSVNRKIFLTIPIPTIINVFRTIVPRTITFYNIPIRTIPRTIQTTGTILQMTTRTIPIPIPLYKTSEGTAEVNKPSTNTRIRSPTLTLKRTSSR